MTEGKANRKYIRKLLLENRRLRYALKIARLERDGARNALHEENFAALLEVVENSLASLNKAKEKRVARPTT